jgi:hypothetical protein
MKTVFLGTLTLLLLLASCGGRKHDADYYMAMVDSIRKAEQVKDIQQKAGIYNDPVEAWFDTLQLRTLPIQSAGTNLALLGEFKTVPMNVNEYFGYNPSAKLKAIALPSAYRRQVILLAEMVDSITPRMQLYVMDKKHMPIDQLCIYEQANERFDGDYGKTFMEYFITTKYEITLMLYFQSHNRERKPELLNSRRFLINKDGMFEETVIELE